MSSAREEVPVTPRLTVAEQVRGDIILNTWEANIAESKIMAKQINEDCEEVFDLLNKESLSIGKDDCFFVKNQTSI
jgi:hypothetical protein